MLQTDPKVEYQPSLLSLNSCCMSAQAEKDDLPDLNPCWLGGKMLFSSTYFTFHISFSELAFATRRLLNSITEYFQFWFYSRHRRTTPDMQNDQASAFMFTNAPRTKIYRLFFPVLTLSPYQGKSLSLTISQYSPVQKVTSCPTV